MAKGPGAGGDGRDEDVEASGHGTTVEDGAPDGEGVDGSLAQGGPLTGFPHPAHQRGPVQGRWSCYAGRALYRKRVRRV